MADGGLVHCFVYRAKDPEGNAKMILDFESQLEVIKVHTPIRYSVSFRVLTMDQHLDHEPIANLALKTKLNKDRLLLQNEHMQTAISTELSPNLLTSADPGTAARKVQDRLLSSKTLAVEVLSVLTALKEMVDPSLRKGPEQAPDAEGSDDEPPSKVKKAKAPSRPVGGSGDEHEGGDESTAPEVDAAGWESGTVRGDDDDDGWESGSVDDANPRGQSIAGGADSDGSEADDSGNEDENSDDEEEDDDDEDDVDGGDNAAVAIASATKRASQQAEKGKKVALPAKDTKGKSKATAESTFLPSLSVGFTRGDSDASDLSDEEVKVADMRKNRRGQRARRAYVHPSPCPSSSSSPQIPLTVFGRRSMAEMRITSRKSAKQWHKSHVIRGARTLMAGIVPIRPAVLVREALLRRSELRRVTRAG